jgi:hypothetical protein
MVHRDPQTGQFIAGGSPAHYDDFEFQHVHSRYAVPASELPGAFPIAESDINSTDLDDLLDRDERAELVAVLVHSLQAAVPGTSSAESVIEGRFELRAGVGDELILPEDRDRDTDAGSSSAIDRRIWDSDSPDMLYSASLFAEGGFSDTGNSVAAGPDAPVLDQSIHFPRDFGACPEFDDRDSITESVFVSNPGSGDISDSFITIQASYTLVFAVHERE